MKQELPIAVVLLAAGFLLWFWQSDREKQPVLAIQSMDRTDLDRSTASPDRRIEIASRVVAAEFQADVVEPNSDSNVSVSHANTKKIPRLDAKARAYIHQQANRETIQLMSSIAERLAASQPFASNLRMQGNLFGSSIAATGTYSQMGQGTHKSRIELKFGTKPNAPSVFQLCDGRFVYHLQTCQTPNASSGKKQTFEFVDLLRVQQTAGERATGVTPTGWVATGGVSSLFQHLASAFNFGACDRPDETTVVLRGSWAANSLRSVAIGPLNDGGDPGGEIRWEKIPPQLPHAVELSLQQNSDLSYFPARITFLKFILQKDNRYLLQPCVTLLMSPPQPLGMVDDGFFVIDSANLDSIDATDRYLARIDAFDETRQAAEQVETMDR